MLTIPFVKKVTLFCCLISCVLVGHRELNAMQIAERIPCLFPKNELGNPLMLDRKTLEIGYGLPGGSILWRNRKSKWLFVVQDRDNDAYAQSLPVPKGVEEKINYALFPRDFSIPKDLQVQDITGPDGKRHFKIICRDGIPCEIIIGEKNEYNEEKFEMLYPLSSEFINTITQKGVMMLILSNFFGVYAFILKKGLCSEYTDLGQDFELVTGFKITIFYRYGWPYKIVEYSDNVQIAEIGIPYGLSKLLVKNAYKGMDYQVILRSYPKSEVYVLEAENEHGDGA